MRQASKSISILVLAILTFHVATATIGGSKWTCDCYTHGQEISSCCNCPRCLNERDGLYSYCSVQNETRPDEANDGKFSLKALRCTCGSQDPVLNAKSQLPFIPHAGPACFELPFLGTVKTAGIPPALDDIDLSILVPG